MTTLVLILTILCIATPCYVYLGYPLLLLLLSKVKAEKKIDKQNFIPKVSLIVSCYNEVKVVRNKIENCLALDYPKEKFEIIFVSDGSDDGTDEIIKQYTNQAVRLIRQEGRLGKTSGLNLAVPETQGEIVVFSDANALYEADAIKKLARNFYDPSVGYVVGAALYCNTDVNSAASSEDTYWQYEIFIKKLESRLHSVVGGDGAIYAIRQNLYQQLDAKDINDFVNPLQIIAKGYRGVFEAEAICFEEAAGSFDKEGKRKKRIVNRSFRGLMKVKSVMNPFKTGFFSLMVISHKLLRWLIPFFLIGVALGTVYLSYQGYILFQFMVVLGLLSLWLATIAYFKSSSANISPVFYYPYYFIVINIASLSGIIQAIKGNIQITWSSPRTDDPEILVTTLKTKCIIALLLLASFYLFTGTLIRISKIF